MSEFIDAILAFPTAAYTVLLGILLVYWFMVILGAFDIEMFDVGGEVDGAIDGAVEGAVEGAAEGAAEGAMEAGLEAGAEGVGEADVDVDVDADGGGSGLSGIMSALGIQGVPLTITVSAIVLYGWFLSILGMDLLGGAAAGGGLTGALIKTGVGLGAFALGVVGAAFSVRPFRGVFETHEAKRSHEFIGMICTVRTVEVTDDFGQAEVRDGGAGLIVQVRCLEPNGLTTGQEAMIFDYDKEQHHFLVVPRDKALPPVRD